MIKQMRKEMQTQDTVCCRLQDRPEFELWLPLTLLHYVWKFASVQFSCLVVSESLQPMDCSMPGLPVHHQLPQFTQTHVHRVGDAIQPSYPLLFPSPPAPNPSQHQGLFQWVNSLHEVAKYWSFSFSISPSNEHPGLISFRMDCLVSLQFKGLSRVFTNTTVQKHHFFCAQLFL